MTREIHAAKFVRIGSIFSLSNRCSWKKLGKAFLPRILSVVFRSYQLAEHMTPVATVPENFTTSEYFMDVMAANLSSLSCC